MKIRSFIESIRLFQWSKNLLIFLPTILAHEFKIIILVIPFLFFNLSTSVVYLINDYRDRKYDKLHYRKKNRPVAKGEISLNFIIIYSIIIIFLIISYSILFNLIDMMYLLFLYFILTSFYTLYLKHLKYIDVVFLSLLFNYRIIYGGIIGNTYLSTYLLAFAFFFFLSLAFSKRLNEIGIFNDDKIIKEIGRPYTLKNKRNIFLICLFASIISMIIFVFYIISNRFSVLYNSPQLLFFSVFLLFAWVIRINVLSYRSKLHDDPIVFALKDLFSYFIGILIIVTFYLSKIFNA